MGKRRYLRLFVSTTYIYRWSWPASILLRLRSGSISLRSLKLQAQFLEGKQKERTTNMVNMTPPKERTMYLPIHRPPTPFFPGLLVSAWESESREDKFIRYSCQILLQCLYHRLILHPCLHLLEPSTTSNMADKFKKLEKVCLSIFPGEKQSIQ